MWVQPSILLNTSINQLAVVTRKSLAYIHTNLCLKKGLKDGQHCLEVLEAAAIFLCIGP